MEGEGSSAEDTCRGVVILMDASPLHMEAVITYALVFVQISLSETSCCHPHVLALGRMCGNIVQTENVSSARVAQAAADAQHLETPEM